MKHRFTRIAAIAAACALLNGCVFEHDSLGIELPVERPEPVQSQEQSRPSEYQPGVPVTPGGLDDFSSSTSSSITPIESSSTSRFRPNIPSNFRDLIFNSSTSVTDPIEIPQPDRTSLLTDYTKKWAYNQLDSAQKTAYALLFESVSNGEYGYEFPDRLINKHLDVNDIKKVYWAFDYDNAQFIELGNGYAYTYFGSTVESLKANGLRPDENGDNYAQLRSEFERAAQNVLNDALRENSGYDQLLFIHDWIVNNTEYRRNGPKYISEADGAIVNGIALCEGYSKSFMYLAQALGYNCVCVCGKANGEDHMWNMVELDGRWYHVDVTWDDPVMPDGSSALYHDYFLISDSTILKDHYIENPFAIPKARIDYQR